VGRIRSPPGVTQSKRNSFFLVGDRPAAAAGAANDLHAKTKLDEILQMNSTSI
jgi:hypothetical protein